MFLSGVLLSAAESRYYVGGSWFDPGSEIQLGLPNYGSPEDEDGKIGFRLAGY